MGSQNRQTVYEGKLFKLGEALNPVLVVALLKQILAGKYEWDWVMLQSITSHPS